MNQSISPPKVSHAIPFWPIPWLHRISVGGAHLETILSVAHSTYSNIPFNFWPQNSLSQISNNSPNNQRGQLPLMNWKLKFNISSTIQSSLIYFAYLYLILHILVDGYGIYVWLLWDLIFCFAPLVFDEIWFDFFVCKPSKKHL